MQTYELISEFWIDWMIKILRWLLCVSSCWKFSYSSPISMAVFDRSSGCLSRSKDVPCCRNQCNEWSGGFAPWNMAFSSSVVRCTEPPPKRLLEAFHRSVVWLFSARKKLCASPARFVKFPQMQTVQMLWSQKVSAALLLIAYFLFFGITPGNNEWS